jgi:glycosyltransferase involved in cell wall biosynthesis
LISVITATHNRAKTLPRSLDSLLRQTYTDWECILVDDGSTDETAQVIAQYSDPRIHAYTHPVNRGVTAAKNTGLNNIHGEWFTFLDSDDELLPEALATVLEIAERTGADSVIANCVDSVTGKWTGIGPTHDGFLTPAEEGAMRGDHWGITNIRLLGDLRFNERLPTVGRTMWLRMYHDARRYYVHSTLRIYHSEGSDMVTKRRLSTRQKVDQWLVMSEETEYLRILRKLDPPDYRRTMLRIWAARLANPFVSRA